jgi:magnesium chelatase family protein
MGSEEVGIVHAIVYSGAILGVDGLTVEVEVDLCRGIPVFSIVGLPNAEVRESRERVTAAVKNSGREFPIERITVNLAPADIKKEGAAFDLAVAVGIIVAHLLKRSDRTSVRLERTVMLGELALDGTVRSVRGVLPILLHARAAGFERAIIPRDNFAECLVVGGLEVFGVTHLNEALAVAGRFVPEVVADEAAVDLDLPHKSAEFERGASASSASDAEALDMSDVAGQESVKRALLVAAAGGHHVMMVGPPGAGKTMLARRFTTILPPLDDNAAVETTRIYSIAGLLNGAGLVTRSPFRSPHHSASDAGLIGGGSPPRPGEVTLAHNGVLFLDELPEFRRHVLETLREPLEEGRIVVSRARHSVSFPSRFQLVASMNPCPCGHRGGNQQECLCTPFQVQRYLGKVSGPLQDRISIHVFVRPVETAAFAEPTGSETSGEMRAQVMTARARQLDRGGALNARLTERAVRTHCRLGSEPAALLVTAQKRLRISARGRGHILRVARTIADLDGHDAITADHLAEAVQYRIRELPM